MKIPSFIRFGHEHPLTFKIGKHTPSSTENEKIVNVINEMNEMTNVPFLIKQSNSPIPQDRIFLTLLSLSKLHQHHLLLRHLLRVGKSSFVNHKISQTLASFPSRSSFLHPVDALHGDIGALSINDILVIFSNSRNSEELLRLAPCAMAKGAYLISVTSSEANGLVGLCDLNVYLPLERELCPFDLAPVTSTAIQMVFGDTVAVAMMGARNLSKEEYAANHPAGRIGKSLIFKVSLWDLFFRYRMKL